MAESTDSSKYVGGLYSQVPQNYMVSEFNDWCFDESRVSGDTDIVGTDYGYHIMYYVGDDELSLRDVMIKEDLTAEDMKKWLEETEKPYTVTDVNLKRVYFDYLP